MPAIIAVQTSTVGNTGAGPAGSVTIAKPATQENDWLLARITIEQGSTPVVTEPAGWTLLRRTDNGTDIALISYIKKMPASGEPASYVWTFDASYEAAGIITNLRSAHNDVLIIINIENGQTTASGTTHAAPDVTSTHDDCLMFGCYAVKASATWTPPTGMTERGDTRTTGPNAVATEGASLNHLTQGATGVKTATSSVAGVGCTQMIVFLPIGIARPTISSNLTFYDVSLAANGTHFTLTEAASIWAGEMALQAGLPYRTYKSTGIIWGRAGGTAPTKIIDDSFVLQIIAAGVFAMAGTSYANTGWEFGVGVTRADGTPGGTKGCAIYTGTSVTINGRCQLFDSILNTVPTAQTLTLNPGATGVQMKMVQNLFVVSAGMLVGQSFPLADFYNCDCTSEIGVPLQTVLADRSELVTSNVIAGAAAALQIGTNDSVFKDFKFFGSPSNADIRILGAGVNGKRPKMVRLEWTDNAPRLDPGGETYSFDDGLKEVWYYQVQLQTAAGARLSGKPVELVDVLGNVIFSAFSDSNGQVAFGAGSLLNAVTVEDRTISGGVNVTRARSPFTIKVNHYTQAGYDQAYLGTTYTFTWPSTPQTFGNKYRDLFDIVILHPVVGGGIEEWRPELA